jgi:hypothetical protein
MKPWIRCTAAAALVGFGCGAPESRPQPGAAGLYGLVRSTASELPVELDFSEGCLTALMYSEVELDAEGQYTSRFNIQRACPDSTLQLPDPGVTGRYNTSPDSLFFIAPDGQVTGRARLRRDTLTVRGERHELIYVRRPDQRSPQ